MCKSTNLSDLGWCFCLNTYFLSYERGGFVKNEVLFYSFLKDSTLEFHSYLKKINKINFFPAVKVENLWALLIDSTFIHRIHCSLRNILCLLFHNSLMTFICRTFFTTWEWGKKPAFFVSAHKLLMNKAGNF